MQAQASKDTRRCLIQKYIYPTPWTIATLQHAVKTWKCVWTLPADHVRHPNTSQIAIRLHVLGRHHHIFTNGLQILQAHCHRTVCATESRCQVRAREGQFLHRENRPLRACDTLQSIEDQFSCDGYNVPLKPPTRSNGTEVILEFMQPIPTPSYQLWANCCLT